MATASSLSFAWIAVFDATHADERPYAGSSHNNTMLELVVGHNGVARLGTMANRASFLA